MLRSSGSSIVNLSVIVTCKSAIKIDTHLLKHPPSLLIERTVMHVLLSRVDAYNRWQAAPDSRAVASGPTAFVVWSHLDHTNASILLPAAWKAEAKEGLLLPRKSPSFPSSETHLWKPRHEPDGVFEGFLLEGAAEDLPAVVRLRRQGSTS